MSQLTEADGTDLRQRLNQLMPEWAGERVEIGAFLEGGYSNRNFRVRVADADYVIRLPGTPQAFVDRSFEGQILSALPNTVGVPVVAHDPVDGSMLTVWTEGDLLEERNPEPGMLVRGYLAIRNNLERVPLIAERSYDPIALSQHYLDGLSLPPEATRIVATDWQPETPGCCHNDLNPYNIIVTADGTWRLLDWEFAGANDPLFDFVSLVLGWLPDSGFLDRCVALLPETPPAERLERCVAAFWLREFAWAERQVAMGNTRDEVVTQRHDALAQLAAL